MTLPEPILARLSQFVAREMALEFPENRWRDLERGIESAARAAGEPDAEQYARWLLSAPLSRGQIENLAGELTVGETYFFRETGTFDALTQQVLPELMRMRQGREQRLRIWSAGCCTGEEAYSIAILLDRVLPATGQWQVSILATDINPRYLRKAAAGIYTEWSFRNPPPWLKERYFTALPGKRYQVLPRIRERVRFEYLNLAEDSYPSLSGHTNAMDLIFCRNVLMYFSAERARRVAEQFRRCLLETGWLIVSATEVSSDLFPRFTPVYFDGAILYRKGAAAAPMEIGHKWPETVPMPPPPEPVKPLAASQPADVTEGETERAAKEQAEPEIERMISTAKNCANMGDLSEALMWTERALAVDRLRPGVHYLRATILQEQGAPEEAAAALKRAIYLEPEFVLAHFALGNLALGRGRRAEAERHFARALEALAHCEPGAVLAESDGLAAERLKQIIALTMEARV